ncbi:MAG: hypothetical protein HY000_18390 [Planctomycetes bacterium]|nr:hypothetical protein [Planctomycetota bacterium]
MRCHRTISTRVLRLGRSLVFLWPLLALLAGCAANKNRVDESFLKQVEKDPFPSASSKGLAAK